MAWSTIITAILAALSALASAYARSAHIRLNAAEDRLTTVEGNHASLSSRLSVYESKQHEHNHKHK